jgi:thiamine-monophosphate kinase
MEEKIQRTEIASLGEFGLIKHLTKDVVPLHKSTIVGIGDDAAVLNYNDKRLVVTTDLLMEGIHFDLMYVPLKHLGYKSIIVNLSDVYAMNAVPKQVTVSLAISNRFSVEALEDLYEGIKAACEKYNVDLVGGDTSTSNKGLVISITAIGEADDNKYVLRSTAKKGDLLCVTGDLGGAYLGLQILEREKRIFLENANIKPDLEEQTYLIGRQLKPEARKDIIEWFAKNDLVPTSMIDISDGLSSEILHICEQSKVGCRLDEEKIPVSDEAKEMAMKFNLDYTTCALSGGEDYELLFTIKQEDYDKIKGSPDISVIGYMTEPEEGIKLITKGGNLHNLTAQGWNAFIPNN